MPKKKKMLIEKVYMYTLNKDTYKGSCKILKVVDIIKGNDQYFEYLVLSTGQKLYVRDIADIKNPYSLEDFYYKNDLEYRLDSRSVVFTIRKIINFENFINQIKEKRILHLKALIDSTKNDIKACKSRLKFLNSELNRYTKKLIDLEDN